MANKKQDFRVVSRRDLRDAKLITEFIIYAQDELFTIDEETRDRLNIKFKVKKNISIISN